MFEWLNERGPRLVAQKAIEATLLRQIEVLMAQGKSAPEACRETGSL
jgi:hypothetical protein